MTFSFVEGRCRADLGSVLLSGWLEELYSPGLARQAQQCLEGALPGLLKPVWEGRHVVYVSVEGDVQVDRPPGLLADATDWAMDEGASEVVGDTASVAATLVSWAVFVEDLS